MIQQRISGSVRNPYLSSGAEPEIKDVVLRKFNSSLFKFCASHEGLRITGEVEAAFAAADASVAVAARKASLSSPTPNLARPEEQDEKK